MEHTGVFGHEQVAFCHHRGTGLRAIVALYSTALGPGLGGTRFYPYDSEDDALEDVLHLSRAMAYKNSLAGLDHGGGKAVIIGDPRTDKSPDLLRAYGRFVQGLGGRYITAADVGTYVQDMDVIAEACEFVTGRSPDRGGAGDSSVLTAFGVYQGMRAAPIRRRRDRHRWRRRSRPPLWRERRGAGRPCPGRRCRSSGGPATCRPRRAARRRACPGTPRMPSARWSPRRPRVRDYGR